MKDPSKEAQKLVVQQDGMSTKFVQYLSKKT